MMNIPSDQNSFVSKLAVVSTSFKMAGKDRVLP